MTCGTVGASETPRGPRLQHALWPGAQRCTCFLRASSSSSSLFLSSSCWRRRISSCCLRSSSCLFRSSSSRFALISASLLSCSSCDHTRALLGTLSHAQEHPNTTGRNARRGRTCTQHHSRASTASGWCSQLRALSSDGSVISDQ